MSNQPFILAIESSCDETSAAVLQKDVVLSNVIATQQVHERFGGVVPELASRAHQQNIVPVVDRALAEAGISKDKLSAVAYTQGPGLMGALLVGASFAKSMALALDVPLIPVHHMRAHIMAHFIRKGPDDHIPEFPFLCLTVSGGHTQLVLVRSVMEMEVVGQTIDDAAGEAFDKAAKVLGLPYPGGPWIDKRAKEGDPFKYKFTTPQIKGFDYSFSGLKTNLLYFLREQHQADSGFIEREMNHICASYQQVITHYLLSKMESAAIHFDIKNLALAGGVSANSALREKFTALCDKHAWRGFIPAFEYCTDNAAMIGIAGYYQWLAGAHGALEDVPKASWKL